MYFIAAIRRIYRIINKIKHKKVRIQDFVYILICVGKKKKVQFRSLRIRVLILVFPLTH